MSGRDPRPHVERLRQGLVPIAAAQPGVCATCRSGASGDDRCWRCSREGIVAVLPISMSVNRGPLHERLRFYKDGGPDQRTEYTLDLAALLFLFLRQHLACLGGEPELVVTVPSASRDAAKAIIDRIRWLRERHSSLTAVGTKEDPSYLASRDVNGRHVLLLDDTLTKGRSMTAAHAALTDAGARDIRTLVIGRHFHPDYSTSVRLWDCLQQHAWSLDHCGICGPVQCGEIDTQELPLR